MENKITEEQIIQLINGSRELSYDSVDNRNNYRSFAKEKIEKNEVLTSFLKNNAELKIHDIKKDNNAPTSVPDSKLVIYDGDFMFVHEKANIIIYLYCIYNLKPSIDRFKTNISICHIKPTKIIDNYFYYRAIDADKVKPFIYAGLEFPNALKHLIELSLVFQFSAEEGYIINMNEINSNVIKMDNDFDFSKVVMT